jgi:intein/homing endonuclease
MRNWQMTPIESIKIGDTVIDAYDRPQTVENVLTYDCDEEVLELVFPTGRVIRCTKDHKFLTTNRGWVTAQELTEEDDVKEVDLMTEELEEAARRLEATEKWMRENGWDEITPEQRKKNLALNIALLPWPID